MTHFILYLEIALFLVLTADEMISQLEYILEIFQNINNESLGNQDFDKVLNDNLEYLKEVKQQLEK